ncbi:glycine receptor subunit alpha-2-like [Branchiostoma lanceolatum]|uniref:glycine receptor subunit alpha-2-like n=1 Tax=Branchiostoma lanceolatum TaxID=7740 RepID=UPI003454C57F
MDMGVSEPILSSGYRGLFRTTDIKPAVFHTAQCQSQNRENTMFFAFSLLYLSFGTLVPVEGTQTIDDVINIFGDKLHIMRPGYGADVPVEVTVDIFIEDIKMDGVKPVMTLDMFVRQSWQDDRLSFVNNDSMSTQSITLSGEDKDLIWTPDVFFDNLVDGFVHDIFQDNNLIRISSNGDVLFSQRLSIDVRCYLLFQTFPSDAQLCRFGVESFSHKKTDVDLLWGDYPVELSPNVDTLQFGSPTMRTSVGAKVYSTGTYRLLVVEARFHRHMGIHVILFQIPSILLVILSWTSFWLPGRVAHARMLICIFLLVVHMALSFLPRALILQNVAYPYMTWMDIWMAISTTFIFLAVLETAAAAFLHRNQDERSSDDGVARPEGGAETIPMTDFGKPGQSTSGRKLSGVLAKLDFISRIAFPALYLLATIIYWARVSYIRSYILLL